MGCGFDAYDFPTLNDVFAHFAASEMAINGMSKTAPVPAAAIARTQAEEEGRKARTSQEPTLSRANRPWHSAATR